MRRMLVGVALACGCVLALGSALPARALIALPSVPSPGPMKVKQVDLIITGEVFHIDNKTFKAKRDAKAKKEETFKTALLRVHSVIKGAAAKGKTIKVAFAFSKPFVRPPIGVPGRPIRPRPFPIRGLQLNTNMDGMFFLHKHPSGKFYVLPMYYDAFVNSSSKKNFDNQVSNTRKLLKIVDNPLAGLRSNKSETRLLAAYVMLYKYRQYPQGYRKVKQVPISKEESRLIMDAIAKADWDYKKYQYNYQLNPQSLFSRSGATQAGFRYPPYKRGEPNNVRMEKRAKAAKEWIKKNLNTFVIKKYVGTEKAKPGVPGGPIIGRPVPGIPRPPIKILPGRPIKIRPLPGILPVPPPGGGGAVPPVKIRGGVQIAPAIPVAPRRIGRKDD